MSTANEWLASQVANVSTLLETLSTEVQQRVSLFASAYVSRLANKLFIGYSHVYSIVSGHFFPSSFIDGDGVNEKWESVNLYCVSDI